MGVDLQHWFRGGVVQFRVDAFLRVPSILVRVVLISPILCVHGKGSCMNSVIRRV